MSKYAKDYISQSLQEFKISRLGKKRKEVIKYLDFYSGT